MKRRAVLGMALASPLVTLAQPQQRVYRVGYLHMRGGPAAHDEAFAQAMHELGYVAGRNLAIEYRWAGDDPRALDAHARDLARLGLDVIVGAAVPVILALRQATRRTPIVMAAVSDPVATGLVESLARPGGNVTGMTVMSADLASKRLQVVREVVPDADRVAVLAAMRVGPAGRSATDLVFEATRAAARPLGIETVQQVIADGDGLAKAFAEFDRQRARAVLVQLGPLMFEHRAKIVALGLRYRLPDLHEARVFVEAGSFASYGPDVVGMYRRAATFVDRILRGARPGDLPIEQPSKFELVLNARTAKALDIALPQALLMRADVVIR